uniref:Uncharacterized protein n=1 Tax=Oryza rufipogon TaxID=4529 RepID=A0A0E0R5A5_ORYRU
MSFSSFASAVSDEATRRRVAAPPPAYGCPDAFVSGARLIKYSWDISTEIVGLELDDLKLLKISQLIRDNTLQLEQNPEFWEAQEAIWDVIN